MKREGGMQRDGILIRLVLIAAMFVTGCEKELTSEQRHQRSIAEVGFDASIAAAFVASASRACFVIGINNLERCAENKGALLAEQSASISAGLALGQRDEYWKKCQSNFSEDYCKQLIDRAVAIEFRKPVTSN